MIKGFDKEEFKMEAEYLEQFGLKNSKYKYEF